MKSRLSDALCQMFPQQKSTHHIANLKKNMSLKAILGRMWVPEGSYHNYNDLFLPSAIKKANKLFLCASYSIAMILEGTSVDGLKRWFFLWDL